jgi:hypothetical protein
MIENKIVYLSKYNYLIVIEKDEQKLDALDKLFNADTNMISLTFTKYVTSKYINIKREDVYHYQQTNGYFQVTKILVNELTSQ